MAVHKSVIIPVQLIAASKKQPSVRPLHQINEIIVSAIPGLNIIADQRRPGKPAHHNHPH